MWVYINSCCRGLGVLYLHGQHRHRGKAPRLEVLQDVVMASICKLRILNPVSEKPRRSRTNLLIKNNKQNAEVLGDSTPDVQDFRSARLEVILD